MRYQKNKPADKYVGWKLSEDLVECSLSRGGPKELCAEFRYVVLHDGEEVAGLGSKIHLPDYVVLSKSQLLDTSPRAYAGIMGIKGELTKKALEKFERHANAGAAQSSDVIPMRQPRPQLAAEQAAPQEKLAFKA